MSKTKFILHGGETRVINPLNKKFFTYLTEDIKTGAQIFLVYFASKENRNTLLANDQASLTEYFKNRKFNLIVANEKNFINQIKESAVIHLRGGDIDKLIQALNKFPDFADLIKGKIISGSSAGAYALAKYYYDRHDDEFKEGLGIIPIKIMCHYIPAEQKTVAEKFKEYKEDLELVTLSDFESKVIFS